MSLLAALLILWQRRRWIAAWGRRRTATLQATRTHKEHRVLMGWAASYALVTLAAGGAGMTGIAGGLPLLPLLHVLALSALTLASTLLIGIATLLACLEALPERKRDRTKGPSR